jgi:hypothetical protein
MVESRSSTWRIAPWGGDAVLTAIHEEMVNSVNN